jgi:hypothetical protein
MLIGNDTFSRRYAINPFCTTPLSINGWIYSKIAARSFSPLCEQLSKLSKVNGAAFSQNRLCSICAAVIIVPFAAEYPFSVIVKLTICRPGFTKTRSNSSFSPSFSVFVIDATTVFANVPSAFDETVMFRLSKGEYALSIISVSNKSHTTIPVSLNPASSSFCCKRAGKQRKMFPAPI